METLLPRLNEPLDASTYPEFVSPSFGEQLTTILSAKAPELFVTVPFRPAYANASGNNGSVHVALIPGKRNFLTELRRAGITIGWIDCHTIEEVCDIFVEWLRAPLDSKDAKRLWPHARILDDAELYECGDKVDRTWNAILYLNGGTSEPFLREAAKIPGLRGLLPFSSMSRLCFSRCTKYPYSQDCPVTWPLGCGKYGIALTDNSEHVIEGAAAAARFVANHLPKGTGRAIDGDADDLRRR